MKIAINGFVNVDKALTITGESFNVDIAADMDDNPTNKIPKPRMTSPIFWIFGFLDDINMITPAKTNKGAISDKLKAINCPVIVVPMLAPIIIPVA